MKLEKAIEILTYPPAHTFDQLSPDYFSATKLGIEALKDLKLYRLNKMKRACVLLPGETKD